MLSRPAKFSHRTSVYRKTDRVVFTATIEGIVPDAQPQLSTDCEIVWTKVKTRNRKDTYLCSFYMPHRSMTDIHRLEDSLCQVTQPSTGKHILLAGDFNCPDIDWEMMTVQKGAAEKFNRHYLICP